MNLNINYKNNPLHGVSLKNLLIEIVDHYGFDILFAYLNINCFKSNPSIDSSVKFLKKTDWAREKVEAFYLYQFKSLPRASTEQFELPPRERVIPQDQIPGQPAELSMEMPSGYVKNGQKKQPHAVRVLVIVLGQVRALALNKITGILITMGVPEKMIVILQRFRMIQIHGQNGESNVEASNHSECAC